MELQTDLWTKEVILEGQKLRLEPLGLEHMESLTRHALFDRQFVTEFGGCMNRDDVEKEVRSSMKRRADRLENGFALVDKASGEAVGYSNFLYMDRNRLSVDIGRTRIGRSWHKTYVNTEAKLLMLTYAFETLGCIRVGFKVDFLNFNSQRAVKRIGGRFEGEIRHYLKLPDGRKRDYHSYSIIDSEWPNIKTTLLGYLEKYNVSSPAL
ncbi:GNAT family N-acetyltransferase [Bdellovibrio sp. HCB2-146]|uniref:GNAT family N-acetyltransferase n=1 Tax=Bdellovibrio sp. HCB2-146 TaxID=3394362 RepID=UPI0039BD1BAA